MAEAKICISILCCCFFSSHSRSVFLSSQYIWIFWHFSRSTVWHLVYFISVLSFILCVIFFSFTFFSFQNTNKMSNKTLNCPRLKKSTMPELRIQYALLQFPLHLRNEKKIKIKTKTTAIPTMKKSWKKSQTICNWNNNRYVNARKWEKKITHTNK